MRTTLKIFAIHLLGRRRAWRVTARNSSRSHSVGGAVVLLAIGFVVGVAGGCGPRPIPATTVSTSQAAWDRAVADFESGDVAAALEPLNVALGSPGGLDADLYANALLMRTVCLAAARRSDEAEADLELAAEGVTDPDQLCIARAAVCFSRGERPAAERQMTEALNWNRRASETPLWKAAKAIAADGR